MWHRFPQCDCYFKVSSNQSWVLLHQHPCCVILLVDDDDDFSADNLIYLSLTPFYFRVSPWSPVTIIGVCACLLIHPDDRGLLSQCVHKHSCATFYDCDGRQSSRRAHTQAVVISPCWHDRLNLSLCPEASTADLIQFASIKMQFLCFTITAHLSSSSLSCLLFPPWTSFSYLTPSVFLSRCHLHSVSRLISPFSASLHFHLSGCVLIFPRGFSACAVSLWMPRLWRERQEAIKTSSSSHASRG